MDNRCTVLVNSCDKYEEAWLPFFSLLKKYWPQCEFQLAINTETKIFENNWGIITYNSNEKTWGRRLFECVNQIHTPFILCMLEDFFIQRDVLHEEIIRCISNMEKDDRIGVVYFNKISGYTMVSDEYPDYIEMKWEETNDTIGTDGTKSSQTNPLYMFNCQAAIWRKELLLEACQRCASPWEFEEHGFEKADPMVRRYKYFCSKTTRYDKLREGDVFGYLLIRSTGYGIWRSKWLWNNKKLFRREGIKCECKTLPTVSWFRYYMDCYVKAVIKKITGLIHNVVSIWGLL